jgi:hypothetical protein
MENPIPNSEAVTVEDPEVIDRAGAMAYRSARVQSSEEVLISSRRYAWYDEPQG